MSSDAVSEMDEGSQRETVGRATSLAEQFAPKLARHAGSGNLAIASGVVSLVRAGRTFLKGNRKRAVVQALVGLFWVGVALAQRRSGESGDARSDRSGTSGSRSGEELSEVVGTAPDVEGAVEPGGRETDHATGEAVVDTTDADVDAADVEATDTASEGDQSSSVEDAAAESDVDQRDVVDAGDVEDVAEDDAEESAGRTEGESAE